jgi:hypothetical protein
MKDDKLNVVKRRLMCKNRITFNCKTRSKGKLTRKCFTVKMNRTFLNSTTYQNLETNHKKYRERLDGDGGRQINPYNYYGKYIDTS